MSKPEKPVSVGTLLLTEDNFKYNVLQSNEMWLVAFIDPQKPGIDIKPIWDKASIKLMNKVNLGKVFSKNLARECGVTNFPTIMLFPAGDKSNQNSFENYNGEFTTNSIVSWALEKYNGNSDNGKFNNPKQKIQTNSTFFKQ